MKAVALISGGLDSVLAAKIVKEQGIFVVGLHVKIPFVAEKKEYARLSASQIGIPLLTVHAGEEFLRICLLYTSPSPRDGLLSRMPSSA